MNLTDPAFEARLKAAVQAVQPHSEFAARIVAEVDAFFLRYPELTRTQGAELLVTITIFERLSGTTPNSTPPQ